MFGITLETNGGEDAGGVGVRRGFVSGRDRCLSGGASPINSLGASEITLSAPATPALAMACGAVFVAFVIGFRTLIEVHVAGVGAD